MKKTLTKIGFFLMGLAGLLALLCAVAASCVTNSALMEQGFLKFSSTKHLGLLPSAIQCLRPKACAITWMDKRKRFPLPRRMKQRQKRRCSSEKEMRHLADVRRIIAVLKGVRWLGGGAALLGLGAAYYLEKWKITHRADGGGPARLRRGRRGAAAGGGRTGRVGVREFSGAVLDVSSAGLFQFALAAESSEPICLWR